MNSVFEAPLSLSSVHYVPVENFLSNFGSFVVTLSFSPSLLSFFWFLHTVFLSLVCCDVPGLGFLRKNYLLYYIFYAADFLSFLNLKSQLYWVFEESEPFIILNAASFLFTWTFLNEYWGLLFLISVDIMTLFLCFLFSCAY